MVALVALAALSAAGAGAADVVSVSVSGPLSARAGSEAIALVQVTVKRGFHVQANPVRNPFLIPVVLNVPASSGVVPEAPAYPVHKTMRLLGSDEELVVYDGTFSIRLPLRIESHAPAGRVTLQGGLRYQACDDRHCLFPATLPLELPVDIKR